MIEDKVNRIQDNFDQKTRKKFHKNVQEKFCQKIEKMFLKRMEERVEIKQKILNRNISENTREEIKEKLAAVNEKFEYFEKQIKSCGRF